MEINYCRNPKCFSSYLIAHIFGLRSTLYLTFKLYRESQLCCGDSSHGNQAYWETPPSVRSNTFDRQLWKNIYTINIQQLHIRCNTPRCNKYSNRKTLQLRLDHLGVIIKQDSPLSLLIRKPAEWGRGVRRQTLSFSCYIHFRGFMFEMSWIKHKA